MMNVPTPKNAQEAALQSRVMERANAIALELVHGGEYTAYQQEPGIWGLYKKSGSSKADTGYLLNLNEDTCSCPFFEKEDYCKHLLALHVTLDRIDEAEMWEAFCSEFDARAAAELQAA